MADYIVSASHFDNDNIERAEVFLHTLADVWVVDQDLYHTNTRKRKAYCPICQKNFFGKMQTNTRTHKDADRIVTQYLSPQPMKIKPYKEHIRDKRWCFAHNLLGRFLNEVHDLSI